MSVIVNPGDAALTGRYFFEDDVRLRRLGGNDQGEAQKQRQNRQGKLSNLVVFVHSVLATCKVARE